MSDMSSSLPVRTEQNGDVAVKIVDGAIPSQELKVNADGSIDVNADISALPLPTGASTEAKQDSAITELQDIESDIEAGNVLLTSIDNKLTSPITVQATDFDIRDLNPTQDKVAISDGVNELAVNSDGSINAVIQDEPGEEVVNFNMASSIAGGATSDHDLVVSAGGKLFQVHSSGSGKMKVEVQIETGAATDIFNTVLVGFNSSSAPNIDLQLAKYAVIPAGARVKVIRTNRDLQAQDLYSTIVILED